MTSEHRLTRPEGSGLTRLVVTAIATSHVGTTELHLHSRCRSAPNEPDVCVCPAFGGHSFREDFSSRFQPTERETRLTRTQHPVHSRFGTVSCCTFKTKAFGSHTSLASFTVELFAALDLRGTSSNVYCPTGRCHHRQAPGVSRVERTSKAGHEPHGRD